METNRPTNVGKLVANHQIKFIHWRSHAELETDVNNRLTQNLGKYEIKEIKLDFSQSGARLAMVHYYEHIRLEQVDAKITNNKTNTIHQTGGTKHIAPSQNTPMSHNVKETVQIKPDVNSINNDLDKLNPGHVDVNEQIVVPVTENKKTKLPEWYEVDKPISTPVNVVDAKIEDDDLIATPSRGDLSQEDIDSDF